MIREIQENQKPWVAHNFGDRPAWMPLLGVMEELGELAHSFLKREQGIRVGENHDEKIKDAVGDIVLFLMDFCSANNIDLQSVVSDTWEHVKDRDWKANPKTGTPL
jgi:NTP pyrophosphatase (non-canonical NTP hydrolase)